MTFKSAVCHYINSLILHKCYINMQWAKIANIWAILASWVRPSSCDPGCPPPPDSGPQAWGRGPRGREVLAAGEDAPSGSTAPRRWTPWSVPCKTATTCKKRKQISLAYLYDVQASQFMWKYSLIQLGGSLWIANVRGSSIVHGLKRVPSVSLSI